MIAGKNKVLLISIVVYRMCTKRFSHDVAHIMSYIIRKPDFCIHLYMKTKLLINYAADQRLCFHHIDNTIPLLSKSEISSPKPFGCTAWFVSDLE